MTLGLVAWLGSVLLACWLPSARSSDTDVFAHMTLLYFVVLLVAVLLCSASACMARPALRGSTWRSLGQFLYISGLAWILAPSLLRIAMRVIVRLGFPIRMIAQWYRIPLIRICEASFGIPLAVMLLWIIRRTIQNQTNTIPSSPIPMTWSRRLLYACVTVVLPIVSFTIAYSGFPALGPDWQSGKFEDYILIMLGGSVSQIFYPFLKFLLESNL